MKAATPRPEPQRLAVSVTEAYKTLGIGRTLFYKLVKEGRIKLRKLGGRTVVRVEDLKALLASDECAQ